MLRPNRYCRYIFLFQTVFTGSNLTIKTPTQGVKYAQSNNKDTMLLTPCSTVSIVNFEDVIASWV